MNRASCSRSLHTSEFMRFLNLTLIGMLIAMLASTALAQSETDAPAAEPTRDHAACEVSTQRAQPGCGAEHSGDPMMQLHSAN
jgi:hypothetical protein